MLPKVLIEYRVPIWLPISVVCMLLVGCIYNNLVFEPYWIDFYLTATFFFVFIVFTKLFTSKSSVLVHSDSSFFSYALSVSTLCVVFLYYSTAGIPLLSDDPNVARMEFMQSTWLYKYMKTFLPLVIIYMTAYTYLTKNNRVINIIILFFLVIAQLLSGGKGAGIWATVFILLGLNVVGMKIDLSRFFKYAPILLVITLYLFKHIGDVETWSDTVLFVLERITGIASYGLYVVANIIPESIDVFLPIQFVFDVVQKTFGNLDVPYTLSFGRHVTSIFYGGDPYDYVWELTVSIISDLYVLSGWTLFIPASVLYVSLFYFVKTKLAVTSNLYSRCVYIVLWYHLSLFILTGSLVTELIVRTIPFLVFAGFWMLICYASNRNIKFKF
jgi:hypothetical protein